MTLLFTTTIFGWAVGDDLCVVPDHARHLLQTDHHGVIHLKFRTEDDLKSGVAEMQRRGFLLLDELLDETFKQPRWMKAATDRYASRARARTAPFTCAQFAQPCPSSCVYR